MHNPTLIPALLRDTSVNNGLIYRELHKALPCRIGIEFEMGANFRVGFRRKYPDIPRFDENIAKFYNVLEIRNDSFDISLERALNGDDTIVESRISLKDFHQLSGLYRYMQDLPEFCAIHEGGGIHIHIDMSMFPIFVSNQRKANEVKNWLTNRLNEVQEVFPKYTGKHNKRRVGNKDKNAWINISSKQTLEFRIFPLTFDYYTLMTWIVQIVKLRNRLIRECRLVKKGTLLKRAVNKLPEDEVVTTVRLTTPSSGRIVTVNDNSGSTWCRVGADNTTTYYHMHEDEVADAFT